MLIFLELRTLKGKNLTKTNLFNTYWDGKTKTSDKSKVRFYAFGPLIIWLKVGISNQDRIIVSLMYELSLPGPDRIQLLLYIYSVLFLPVMTCWFVYKILSSTGASTWCMTFKGFNLSFSPNIPFCLSHLSWESLPQTSEFPWVQSFLWLQRALGG